MVHISAYRESFMAGDHFRTVPSTLCQAQYWRDDKDVEMLVIYVLEEIWNLQR